MNISTSIIVTDAGFAPEDWIHGFGTEECATQASGMEALDLTSDTDPATVPLTPALRMIRVDFPVCTDGRGFTIARALRLRGYSGRLRARGAVLADQYAMARRSGFDEVEISAALAARQPQAQWQFRSDWQAHDHQARLRG